jgi:iron complex outermembrane receptor protein
MRPFFSFVLVAAPTLAAAQTRPDSTRRPLDPVVVTATREPRSLTDVPLAVTVLGEDRWATRSGFGMDQALSQVPGVMAQSRFGTHDIRLVIRGFGARGAGDRSNAGTSRGVRVLLDGIPETEPDGRTAFDQIDLSTIERIEVLRSNGSAAWGNAAGGIVSLSSMPTFDKSFSEVQQQSGGFGMLRTIARTGAAVGDGGKVWLSMTRTTFDGWRQHSDAQRSQLVGGAVAPIGGRGRLGVQLAAAANLFRIPGPLTPAQFAANPQQANATYLARDERRFNRLMRLGVTLDQPIGETQDVSAMLYVNPKYLQRSERGTFRDFNRYHVGGNGTWGARFTTGTLAHRVRVGGDFAYQDGAIQFFNLGPGNVRGTTLQTNKGEAAQNAGAFVQDEIAVGDWRLLVGARYDDLSYFYKDFINPAINASRRFSRVTPRLGATYRLAAATSVYASLGGGVEIPAGNETDPPPVGIPSSATALNPLLDPILSTTAEVGTRHGVTFERGALRSVSVDAAVYRTLVNNEPVPYNGGRFYQTAGRVERRGFELGLIGELLGGVTLRGTGTFSDNRYRDYLVDSTFLNRPGFSANYAGNQAVGVPTRILSGSVTWRPTVAPWLFAEVGAQGNGAYFADDANRVRVPGFTMYRASIGGERPLAGGVALRGVIGVENLTNRTYVASAFINPDLVAGAPAVFEAGLPRALFVSFSLRRTQ